MKRYGFYKILILAALLFIINYSCNAPTRSAFEYNNMIVDQEIPATESIYKFKGAIENQNYQELEVLKENAIEQIKKSIENVQSLHDYKGSVDYKNAALSLFETYKGIIENEFTSIIEILKQNRNNIYKNTYQKILDIETQAEIKIESKMKELKKKQMEFAENNNLIISNN